MQAKSAREKKILAIQYLNRMNLIDRKQLSDIVDIIDGNKIVVSSITSQMVIDRSETVCKVENNIKCEK